jgi:hypothetical protein
LSAAALDRLDEIYWAQGGGLHPRVEDVGEPAR